MSPVAYIHPSGTPYRSPAAPCCRTSPPPPPAGQRRDCPRHRTPQTCCQLSSCHWMPGCPATWQAIRGRGQEGMQKRDVSPACISSDILEHFQEMHGGLTRCTTWEGGQAACTANGSPSANALLISLYAAALLFSCSSSQHSLRSSDQTIKCTDIRWNQKCLPCYPTVHKPPAITWLLHCRRLGEFTHLR